MTENCPECHQEVKPWNMPYQLILEVTFDLPEKTYGNSRWMYGPFNKDWTPDTSLPVEILEQFPGKMMGETKVIGNQRIMKGSYDNHIAFFKLARFLATYRRIPRRQEFARYIVQQDITEAVNTELSELVGAFKVNEGNIIDAKDFLSDQSVWALPPYGFSSTHYGERGLQSDSSYKVHFHQVFSGEILRTEFKLHSKCSRERLFAIVKSAPLLESDTNPENIEILLASYKAATTFNSG